MSDKQVEYAFPIGDHYQDGKGMTLRDWFAGRVMAAVIARGIDGFNNGSCFKDLAITSYTMADAMLKERTINETH